MSNGDCCDPIHANERGRSQAPESAGREPLVEILNFDGCPNHEPAVALVERVRRELGIEPELRLVNVPDQEAAQRLRFLGSPTIRIDGVDVDPKREERRDYALSCRVFETEGGYAGQPDEQRVRDAFASSRAGSRRHSIQPEPRRPDTEPRRDPGAARPLRPRVGRALFVDIVKEG